MPENQNVGISLLRVDYSEESWRGRVVDALKRVCEKSAAFHGNNENERRRAIELALNVMYRIASFAAITAKKACWADEVEWRQVAFAKKGAVVTPIETVSGGRTKRYVHLAVRDGGRPLALKEIVVGRDQDFRLAESKLKQILERSGYPHEMAPLPPVVSPD